MLTISGARGLPGILKVLARKLKWVLDFEFAILCHHDVREDGWRIATLGRPDDPNPTLAPAGGLSEALHGGQPRIARDVVLEGSQGPCKSVMLVPLHGKDGVLAVLGFASQQVMYTQDDLRIAAMIGLQLGSVLRSVRVFGELRALNVRLDQANDEKTRLLHNMLPGQIAEKLITQGSVEPVHYDQASVLFTDFVGFTRSAATVEPDLLVNSLDRLFSRFDEIIDRHRLEKLKTIGDAYMAVGGVPEANSTHAVDAVSAALEISEFIRSLRCAQPKFMVWDVRIGIHTGPLIAGIIGTRRFAFDVWGDSVNVAARMEQTSESGRVNISEATYRAVQGHFRCTPRGHVTAKGLGAVQMYFVESKIEGL